MKTVANKLVVCNKCGWISFQVSRTYAEEQVKIFNEYLGTLSLKQREQLYGSEPVSTVKFYERCFCCSGKYTNFRDADNIDHQRAYGHTLQPIISKEE